MSQEILATIAGETITEADFDAYMSHMTKEQQAQLIVNPQAKQHYIDQMITMRLFAKWGEDEKLDESEEYKNIMKDAAREILAQVAVRSIMDDIAVTDDEIQTYYDANQDKFKTGETAKARHILVETEEKCNEIKSEIENGKSFEDAASEYSTCPSKARGGDLGEFGKGQMVKEFEDVAFTAEIGTIVGPIKTQFGYHLLKVDARTDASVKPLDEVKASIEQTLINQKRNKKYQEKVASLKETYLK